MSTSSEYTLFEGFVNVVCLEIFSWGFFVISILHKLFLENLCNVSEVVLFNIIQFPYSNLLLCWRHIVSINIYVQRCLQTEAVLMRDAWKRLTPQSALGVDIQPIVSNVLNRHYFIALFNKVVESKVDYLRGRLAACIYHQMYDSAMQSV